mgnify:CR=1 FL=1
MGKVKQKLRDLSILPTFVLLAVVFLLLAILLVEVERTLLTNAQRDIAFQYSDVVEGFNSEKVWGNQSVYLLSEHDGRMMWLYEMGMWTLPPFTYLACFILAGFVFAGLGRAIAMCFCGKRNIMRMFTHFAKNGEIRLAK